MLQSAKQYRAVLSVWQQVEGGQHQCLWFLLDPWNFCETLHWWNPFTISGSNSPYIGIRKNRVRPLEKVQQWDIPTYHNEVSYDTSLDRNREDWGDLSEALQYLNGAYEKRESHFLHGQIVIGQQGPVKPKEQRFVLNDVKKFFQWGSWKGCPDKL